ncbi:MAG: carbohydrate ABC transporter permease [Treponema sp.]|jgi:multiple sugar transport system permease protein/putative aldouronate transport system permease protein|nr:carbohydrate ABC transporter permease [Treponema sp.]
MELKLKEANLSAKFIHLINILLLGLFSFSCIYPFYFIFINSLSSPASVTNGVYLFPEEFTLKAYENLRSVPGIGSSIIISIGRAVIGSLFTTFCSSFCAYILTRRHMVAPKFFYRFFIVTMYINAGFISYYLLISALNLRNNFLVYILPYGVSAYYIILIKTFIESMPTAIWESAEIDGASIPTIYVRIIVPLAKPILACIVIFAAVFQWNAWSDDLFFMLGSKARYLHCLQFLLYKNLQTNMAAMTKGAAATGGGGGMAVTPQTLKMAMTFVTVIPILCVYPFMQRYFTKGIMLGAVKG